MTQEEKYDLINTTAKINYNEIGSIYCPILNKDIIFNAKGFHHLHYKPDGTPRNTAEKIYKLLLVPLAIPVIKNAVSIYEKRKIEIPNSRKKGAKKIKAIQYALTAIVGRKKPVGIRVIILEIENGENPIFWSIMKH